MHFSCFNIVKKYIKLILGIGNYRKLLRRINCNSIFHRAVIIGTPIHSNLGDHLIAEESIRYVQKLGYKNIIEIPEFLYELFSKKIKISITDDIFIVGGGWMGDMYEDQLVIEHILKKYRKNKIVILPQTIYFSGNGRYSSESQFRQIFLNCNRALISLRDERSYNYCLNVLKFPIERCFLLPDMALMSLTGVLDSVQNRNRIIFSIRDDAEKLPGANQIEKTIMELKKLGFECLYSSTVIPKKVVRLSDRKIILEKKVEEYSRAEIVITDRLHSMVIALLAGTKCIAIDNMTHKVVGVYEQWLKNMQGLYVFSNWDRIDIELIYTILEKNEIPSQIDLSSAFEGFSDCIRGV